jgi:hypothetical protein
MLTPTLCFSQSRYGDFEVFVGMPFIYGRLGGDTIQTEIPFSFGIGATDYNVFSDRDLGIVFVVNFIFPQKLAHTAQGQTNRYTLKDDITVLDFNFGLGYHSLGREAAFRVPVAFGFHFLFISGVLESSSVETHNFNSVSLGFGGSVAAEMHINPSVYFFARLQGFLDFLSVANHTAYTGVNVGGKMAYFIDNREYNVFSLYLGLTPTLGVGLKIDGIVGSANK